MMASRILILVVLMLGCFPTQAGAQTPAISAALATHGKGFRFDCSHCHSPENWQVLRPDMVFEHEVTGFELRGTHAELDCRRCHEHLEFRRIGVRCADCHEDVVHRGELGVECTRCHTEQGWRQSARQVFEHQQTRFPLVGRHALIDCEACHHSLQWNEFVGLPTDCIQCHIGDYQATVAPAHAHAGYPTDCQQCHSVMSLAWSDAIAPDHTPVFPLLFGHAIDDCGRCHTANRPDPRGDDCYDCHAAHYAEAQSPVHSGNGIPTDCVLCHDPQGFAGVSDFDHGATGFPMYGEHGGASCEDCHGPGPFAGRSPDCYSCHAADYSGAVSPPHAGNGIPTECELCHDVTGFSGVSDFDHGATGFPMYGVHATLACGHCHGNGPFAGRPPDCYSCHSGAYASASDPVHAGNGLPTHCETCHEPTGFEQVVSYDHAVSGFPAYGAHTIAGCESCHGAGPFGGQAADCYSCHAADYEGTQDPNHLEEGLPTTCDRCHTPNGWEYAFKDRGILR